MERDARICNDCFEELTEKGPETNVKEFMLSKKNTNDKEAARARFEIEFPIRFY